MLEILQYLDKKYQIIYGEHFEPSDNESEININVFVDSCFVCRNETGIINYSNGVEVFSLNKKIAIFSNKVSIVLRNPNHLYRQVYECLPTIHYILFNIKSILLHAASIIYNGKCLLFAGESGAGKTTFSNLAFKNNFTVLSDELSIITFDDDKIEVAGSIINSDDFTGKSYSDHTYKCDDLFF